MLSSVVPLVVLRTTSDPFFTGLEVLSEAHLNMSSAMKVSGVHVDVSASGMNFRFMGVSRVIGRVAYTLRPWVYFLTSSHMLLKLLLRKYPSTSQVTCHNRNKFTATLRRSDAPRIYL